MSKIWCLFSIYNEYSQPDNNIEALWIEKPSFEALADTLRIRVNFAVGNAKIGRLLRGEEVSHNESDYRLRKVTANGRLNDKETK